MVVDPLCRLINGIFLFNVIVSSINVLLDNNNITLIIVNVKEKYCEEQMLLHQKYSIILFQLFFVSLPSRQDEISQLPEVAEKIAEVVPAAPELSDVSQAIWELTNFASANRRQTLSFTQDQIAALNEAFACLVCKGS